MNLPGALDLVLRTQRSRNVDSAERAGCIELIRVVFIVASFRVVVLLLPLKKMAHYKLKIPTERTKKEFPPSRVHAPFS